MIAEELKIVVKAEVDNAKRELQQTSQQSNRTGAAFAKMAAKYVSAGAAFAAVVNEMRQSLRAFADLERSQNRVAAAAEMSGENLDEVIPKYHALADEIQELTVVSDGAALEMIALAQSMGVASSDMDEVVRGAVGLSRTFGMDTQTAVRAVTNAMEGNFNQIQRYIPAVRNAETEGEKLAAVQEAMANGFEMAEAETETYSGSIAQLGNAWDDLREAQGQLLARQAQPLIDWATDLAKELATSAQAVADLQAAYDTLEEEPTDLEANLKVRQEQLAAAERTLAVMKEDNQVSSNRLQRQKDHLSNLERIVNNLEEQLEIESQSLDIQDHKAAQRRSEARLEEERLKREEQLLEFEREAAGWVDERERAGMSELELLREQLNTLADKRNEARDLGIEYDGIQQKINAIHSEIQELERQELADGFDDAVDSINKMFGPVNELRAHLSGLETDVEETTDTIKKKSEETAEEIHQNFMEAAQATMSNVNMMANAVTSLWSRLNQASSQRTQNRIHDIQEELSALEERHERQLEMAEEEGATDAELTLLKRQQKEERHQAEEEADEKEAELKLKQFEREQQLQIAQAVMNTANAVTAALAAGPIAGPVLASMIGAMGAAEIATIKSQEPPAFEKGGSFVTSGEQLIKVGDGSSPRERVTVEPLSGPYKPKDNDGGDIINIYFEGVISEKNAKELVRMIDRAKSRGAA